MCVCVCVCVCVCAHAEPRVFPPVHLKQGRAVTPGTVCFLKILLKWFKISFDLKIYHAQTSPTHPTLFDSLLSRGKH